MTQKKTTPAEKSSAKKSNTKPPMFKFKAGQLAAPPVAAGPATSTRETVVVVAVYKDGELSPAAKRADSDSNGAVKARLATLQKPGSKGQVLAIHYLDKKTLKTIVLVGLDDPKKLTLSILQKGTEAAVTEIKKLQAKTVFFALHQEVPEKSTLEQTTTLCARTLVVGHYQFEGCKKQSKDQPALPNYKLSSTKANQKQVAQAAATGHAIGVGMYLTRDLGNLPGNICTPSYLASTAKELSKQYKLTADILDEKKIASLGMNSFLSVGKASSEPPRLITLKYNGAKSSKQDPLVLVGKGITFDTGGISLKPGAAMDEMKYDMCGAASVLGTLKAVCELKLPINLVVAVAAAENMPGGNASKPGDIVESLSGQTIEILNTDAEGRLVLCDTLTYVEKFKPAAVVDVATLTGACIIALGHVTTGLFSSSDELADELHDAGKASLDPAWRLPLGPDYHELLSSNFADMANIGGRTAGSITAACFLEKFTEAYPWAHLDIAGTAWHSGKAKGASGRPVPLLTEFVLQRCKK